jgi:DNA-directed RNA polymerase subunit alpha
MFPINKFSIKVVSENDTEGVFEIGPLPKGFGNTIGTTYRRLLLSSIRGAAITSVKIDGVQHEYTTLAGLQNDILEVILALKDIAVISHSDDPVALRINAKGSSKGVVEVKASDIEKNPLVEIITPDLVITRLADAKAELKAEVTVERGLGYALPNDSLRNEVGRIPVDAIFTPVRRVSVDVTDTRVGQQTDLDLLKLHIVTNGTIAPSAALYQAADILVKISEHLLNSTASLLSGKAKEQAVDTMVPMSSDEDEGSKEGTPLSIEDVDMSTRLRNALVNAGYADLRELEGLTEEELKNTKGMGDKSFDELLELLKKHEVKLI